MATKRFHMTVDLVGGLQLPDSQLGEMLVTDDGRRLSAHEARTLFVQKLREGYDVLPTCDNHDEKGHCLGHPTED